MLEVSGSRLLLADAERQARLPAGAPGCPCADVSALFLTEPAAKGGALRWLGAGAALAVGPPRPRGVLPEAIIIVIINTYVYIYIYI